MSMEKKVGGGGQMIALLLRMFNDSLHEIRGKVIGMYTFLIGVIWCFGCLPLSHSLAFRSCWVQHYGLFLWPMQWYNHMKWWRPGELSVMFMVFHS